MGAIIILSMVAFIAIFAFVYFSIDEKKRKAQ